MGADVAAAAAATACAAVAAPPSCGEGPPPPPAPGGKRKGEPLEGEAPGVPIVSPVGELPSARPASLAVDMVVPNYVDVNQAQRTKVVHFPGLLGEADLLEVKKYHKAALASGDPFVLNPQNRQHHKKRCTFLHGASAPDGGLLRSAPHVLAKLVRGAIRAKELGGWGAAAAAESDAAPAMQASGPLADIDIRQLCIRVVELWEYEPGGGLVNDLHYDAGSIVTIVSLVNQGCDFTGGTFRTYEPGGTHKEYKLERGDVIVFLSHKYHNITPVETGRRMSLVVELWQGGLAGWCR